MATSFQLSESMLVNRGLSAITALNDFSPELIDTPPAAIDMLDSFKNLVGANAVVDVNLVGVIDAFKSPLELATYFINAKYAELGGAGGILGATSSAVMATANGAGYSRQFHHGAIYWHPAVGAHEIHGPLRARWRELGAENGFLGFPSSDVTPGADVRSEGVFAHFQGGSIYWTPPSPHFGTLVGAVSSFTLANTAATTASTGSAAITATAGTSAMMTTAAASEASAATTAKAKSARSTTARSKALTESAVIADANTALGNVTSRIDDIGAVELAPLIESSAGAYEVHGAIRAKYLALGAEASILGYPRTDETATPDGVGRFNHFQGGSIYWTPATAAHEVHGLIRERWASQGWERNPQLGYPISDELIPDPRIGHRRPETRKKPIDTLPIDIIKLPAEAATAGFPASVVNTATVATVASVAQPAVNPVAAAITSGRASSALGRLSDKTSPLNSSVINTVTTSAASSLVSSVLDLDSLNVVAIAEVASPASTPAAQRSVNRFADFENGVLFWFRGATAATTLSPLAAASDGTPLSFSGAAIASAAVEKIGRATFEANNMQLASMTFAGTTGYSFDGVQVHNRRHKLLLILQGIENQQIHGPLGMTLNQPVPVTATVELQVEVWFDASRRQIVLAPVDWILTHASSASYAQAVNANLRSKLDPTLWTRFELLTLPDTNSGKPIAVLSVKTLPSGNVAVYIEPSQSFVHATAGVLDIAVVPTVFLSQPN